MKDSLKQWGMKNSVFSIQQPLDVDTHFTDLVAIISLSFMFPESDCHFCQLLLT